MAILTIDCCLSETEMQSIEKKIQRVICGFMHDEISDFDDQITIIEGIHVFVNFNPISLKRLELKSVEIVNDDGDLLESDSAVLKSRLIAFVDYYNSTIEAKYDHVDGYDYAEEAAKERYYERKLKTKK